jgi:hypothetical protein
MVFWQEWYIPVIRSWSLRCDASDMSKNITSACKSMPMLVPDIFMKATSKLWPYGLVK